MKHFNQIRKYLSGKMSADEAKNLEAEISSSKALQQELNAQKIERAVIKKEQEQETYFRSIIDEVKQKLDKSEI